MSLETAPHYVYVIMRNNIDKNRQIAQACHAALEAGRLFKNPSERINHLIVLSVKDKAQLNKFNRKANKAGIRTEMFFEPDWNMGNTAFATEPIQGDARQLFSSLSLWRAVDE